MKILAWKEKDGDIAISVVSRSKNLFDACNLVQEHDGYGANYISSRAYENNGTFDYNELFCIIMYDYFQEHPNAEAIMLDRDTIKCYIVERVSEIDKYLIDCINPKIDFRYSDTKDYAMKQLGNADVKWDEE